MQNVTTFLKVGALLLLVLLGFGMSTGSLDNLQPLWPASGGLVEGSFGAAIMACLFSYLGWANSTFVGEEVREPRKNIPFSIIAGLSLCIAIYIAVNAAFMYVLPFDEVVGSDDIVAADTMAALVGTAGVVFIAAAVMVSTFGTMNTGMMLNPRMYYAMARRDLFFRAFARVHPRFRTPHVSIVVFASLAALSVLVLADIRSLIKTTTPGTWTIDLLAVAAVFIMRKRYPDAHRPYRTFGYPWTPLAFVATSVLYLGSLAIDDPGAYVAPIAVALSGLPFYFLLFRPRLRAAD